MGVKRRAEFPKPAHARLDCPPSNQLVVSNPFDINSVELSVPVAENKILEHRVCVVKSYPDLGGGDEVLDHAPKLHMQGVGQEARLMQKMQVLDKTVLVVSVSVGRLV